MADERPIGGAGDAQTPLIRQATVDDVEVVAPLFDAYRQFYQQAPDPDGVRHFLTHRLAQGESAIFLATTPSAGGKQAVGFTQLYPCFSSTAMRPMWILNDLFVAPEARRQGVARALLQRARAFGESVGAVELMLQTAVDNHAGQALYSGEGWRRDDEYYVYLLPLAR
ncbi:MAG TPA: GNAT family N-acetyltransferase [Ktedonobacterales bacterium]|nr:GNAT family N-acetyltransferase [Ktedonobacterales bacterium]